ncbi:DUF4012 domain-containing protein [Candidatus Peregrinibacteria bacterium]|nr:DUF4012 domain-containing protein [Candidatus Peregrinibacteria bacterium]
MSGKMRDLKKDAEKSKLNLRGQKKLKPIRRIKAIYKRTSPIKEIKDLQTADATHFLYIKGKKLNPPKHFDNLLKIFFVGFIILFVFNALNVIAIGKNIEKELSQFAHKGYDFLISGGKNATQIEFDNALLSFNKAVENFKFAENNLWFLNEDKSLYSKDNNLGNAVKSLLESGQHVSIAGQYFLKTLEEFNKLPLYFVAKNKPDNLNQPSLTDTLKVGLNDAEKAFAEIKKAAGKMENINEDTLPPELSARVKLAKNFIQEVSLTLQAISKNFPALLKLLGDRYPHRYLVLLQNNNEIRPSGGFIGSYALIDVNEGYIENLTVNDVYDIDGSYGGIIEPPEEFKAFTSNWRFRDSNYSQDFPTSSKKARWFLEKEGGPSVDTVIAINQGLLKDLLEITGPVQVGNFGKLDSSNYNLLLSYIIEGKIWGPEDPKHILKIFIPAFKEAILKEENIAALGNKLLAAIQKKHLLMYSADEEIQGLFQSIGATGEVYKTAKNEDYLSVINIATGGTKSEQFIEEKIQHHTKIDEFGNVIDRVTVKRSHLFTDDIYYQWKKIIESYGFDEMPDRLIDILGRGKNRVSMRIYVPEGSVLLKTNGSDVMTKFDKDLKKTYFFTQMEVKAGNSKEIWIEYQLPFNLDTEDLTSQYKLIIQKQPGSIGSIFNKTLEIAEELKIATVAPSEVKLNLDNTVNYSTILNYDRYFTALIED